MSASYATDTESVVTDEETTEDVPADARPDVPPTKLIDTEECTSRKSPGTNENPTGNVADVAIDKVVESTTEKVSVSVSDDEPNVKHGTEPEPPRNPRGRKKTKSFNVDKGRRRSSASVGSDWSTDSKSLPRRHGITFEVGSRLRARDFSKKWYDAKIIDIDDDRMEIKIHFDRWNSRYDQWIPMSSKDLKAVSPDRMNKKNSVSYKTGDEVLAKWRDQNMYPARVEKVYDNGSFLVIFYDGFVNKMTTAHMEPLPSRCVGKLKFPSLEEAKKNRKSSFGAISTALPCLDGIPLAAFSKDIPTEKEDHLPTKEFIIEEDHNHFKCKVSDCNKSFRKENLLASHYKHYHNMKYKPSASLPELKIKIEPPDSDSDQEDFNEKDAPNKKEHHSEVCNRKELHGGRKEPQPGVQKPKEAGRKEKIRSALKERRTFSRKRPSHKRPSERTNSPTVKERKSSLERPTVSEVPEKPPSVKTVTVPLPQRSSTRRVTLPAKFASEEICLMQPLGRDRTLSYKEEKTPKDKEKRQKRRERALAKEASDMSSSKSDVSSHCSHVSKTEKIKHDTGEKFGDSISEDIHSLHSKKKADAETDVSLVKGPAVAKKILQETNPDPDRIERMITIASSRKQESLPKKDKAVVTVKKDDIHNATDKAMSEKGEKKSKLKLKSLQSSENRIRKKDDISSLPVAADAGNIKPPLVEQPECDSTSSVVCEKKDTAVSNGSIVPIAKETEMESAKTELDTDSLSAMAESLSEILNSGMGKSKTDSKFAISVLPEGKSPPAKPTQLSPSSTSSSHVMCTRRKEAILEKEKATQSVRGHVMCTRKKSVKLALGDGKHKQKGKSPAKGEVTPPQSTPAFKKRRFFSPPRHSDVQKKTVPPKAEADPLIRELLSKDPKDVSLVQHQGTLAEPLDDPEAVSAQLAEEEVSKPVVTDEVVHCVCGCWEEEGLMMQCEICLTWQHGSCFNIEEEKDVPEKYACFACLDPKGLREGSRYKFDQSWFKKGEMPFYPFASGTDRSSANAEGVQASHNLVGSLHGVFRSLRSLSHKIHIVSAEAHPDLPSFYKPYSGSSDETENDEKEQDDPDGKSSDPAANVSGSENLELEKHQLTTQNLVTFDHSYYSPEVDILDLNAMPLIIDDDFKSDTSKDDAVVMDTSEPPDDTSEANIKSNSPDILADDHAMTMFPEDKEKSPFDAMLTEVNTSSSTESAKETKDQEALLDLAESIKETCNAAAAAAIKDELDMEDKDQSIAGNSSGTRIMGMLLKKDEIEDASKKQVKLLDDSREPPEGEEGSSLNIGNQEDNPIGEDYTSETSFCKPVSSTSNFFGGLLKDGELELPLVSHKKEDLLNDFNYNAKCKRNLMDHIKTSLSELEPELDRIEELVEALETEQLQLQTQADNVNKSTKKGVKIPNYRKLRRLKKDLETVLNLTNFEVT